jgi:hypothetical protein
MYLSYPTIALIRIIAFGLSICSESKAKAGSFSLRTPVFISPMARRAPA